MKKWMTTTLCLVLAMLMLCSCGAPESAPTTPAADGAAETAAAGNTAPAEVKKFGPFDETVTLHIGRTDPMVTWPEGDTIEDNAWTRQLKDECNIEIVHDTIAPGGDPWKQKLSMMLASGDIPDAMVVDRTTMMQMVENDMLMPLDEIYETWVSDEVRDCYDSFNGQNFATCTFDGKLMALPSCTPNGHLDLLWIRQDWLDNMGLERPDTLDELKEVALAFATGDPDGNGQNDTLGLVMNKDIAGFHNYFGMVNDIFNYFGAYPKQWIEDASGKVVYGSVAPEMKTALQELQDMYKAGIIDKDFALRDENGMNELVVSGKAGIIFAPKWASNGTLSSCLKNDSNANWIAMHCPLDAEGKIHTFDSEPAKDYLVVSKECKNPEAVFVLENVMFHEQKHVDHAVDPHPYYDSETGNILLPWNSYPLSIQIAFQDDPLRFYKEREAAMASGDLSVLKPNEIASCKQIMAEKENPRQDADAWGAKMFLVDGVELVYADNVVKKPIAFMATVPSMELKWAYLTKLQDENLLKIIMGEAPVDSFDTFVEEWYKAGGEEITAEVQEVVNSMK